MVHFPTAALAPVLTVDGVTLANGVRLSCTQYGPKSGDALILLHGYSDSAFSFSLILPLLPSSMRVIAPDLRGHGTSDRPAGGYRIADFADDVIEMMDALRVPRATIVGHSMGSFIAQSLAGRHPERVTSVVLLGSAPLLRNAAVVELQKEVDRLSDPIDPEFVRAFQHSTIVQPVPQAFMDAAIANSRRMPAAVWQQIMRGFMEFEPVVPRPPARVLVIGGEKDAVFTAAEQRTLAALYAGAELILVADVGHSLHWEQPEVFVQALMRFIR